MKRGRGVTPVNVPRGRAKQTRRMRRNAAKWWGPVFLSTPREDIARELERTSRAYTELFMIPHGVLVQTNDR